MLGGWIKYPPPFYLTKDVRSDKLQKGSHRSLTTINNFKEVRNGDNKA